MSGKMGAYWRNHTYIPKDKIMNTKYKKIIIRKLLYGLLLFISSIITILNESETINLDKVTKRYLAYSLLIFVFIYESYIAFKNSFNEVDEQLIYTTNDDKPTIINGLEIIKAPIVPLNDLNTCFVSLKNSIYCKPIDDLCGC